MSQLRVDEIRALDGTETAEVSIPALEKRFLAVAASIDQASNSLNSSLGVSSVTDSGVGNTTVNFSSPLSATGNAVITANPSADSVPHQSQYTALSTTSVRVRVFNSATNAAVDRTVALNIFDLGA